jgi:hypothetical protein
MLYFELLTAAEGKFSNYKLSAGIYALDERLGRYQTPPGIVSYTASRIWREQDDDIIFVKNCDPDQEVDLEEFMWIKLQAEEL